MIEMLKRLLMQITKHPALDNEFYRDWMSRSMGIEELQVFGRNYGAWVASFPDALAILVRTTADMEAKGEYVKTLYSEMGYGNPLKAHSLLLYSFLNELAKKLGEPNRLSKQHLDQEVAILPSAEQLIRGEQELYGDGLRSIGAQLALEWQAYTMLRQLYDGARTYLPLWSNPDEFHEACEYFYTHIGAAEKDHKEESFAAVSRYAVDEESLTRIIDGYDRHLDLITAFWKGLHAAILTVRSQSKPAAFSA